MRAVGEYEGARENAPDAPLRTHDVTVCFIRAIFAVTFTITDIYQREAATSLPV